MAASDTFLPLMPFFNTVLFFRKDAGYVSQTTGTVQCKLFFFFPDVSYGVSILSLIVITGHRYYAVVFPMRARVQSRRTCIILLLLTRVLPIAMSSPTLIFFNFNLNYHSCYMILSTHHIRIWHTIRTSCLFFVPLLVMLVLYPVIIVMLR